MNDEKTKRRKIFFKMRRLGDDETQENQLAWDALGDEENLRKPGKWLSRRTSLKAVRSMNSDFKNLLSLLVEKKVEFLVVGGYAIIHYAEPRYTKDLNLLIGTGTENAQRHLMFSASLARRWARCLPRTCLNPRCSFRSGYRLIGSM